MKTLTLATVMLATQITFAQVTQFETGPIKITPQIREALGTTRIQDGVRIEAMDLNQLRESLRNTKGRAVLHVGPGHEIELEREDSTGGASAEAARPGVLVGSGGQGQNLPLVDLTDGKAPEESTRIMFVTDNWEDFRKMRDARDRNLNREVVLSVTRHFDGNLPIRPGTLMPFFTLSGRNMLKAGTVSYLPSDVDGQSVFASLDEVSIVRLTGEAIRSHRLAVPQLIPIKVGVLNVIPLRKVSIRFNQEFWIKPSIQGWVGSAYRVKNTNRIFSAVPNFATEPYKTDTFFFFPGKYEILLGTGAKKQSVAVEIK